MKSESVPGIVEGFRGHRFDKFIHVADNDRGGRYGNHRDTYMSIKCVRFA